MQKKFLKLLPALLFLFAIPAKAKAIVVLGLAIPTAIAWASGVAATLAAAYFGSGYIVGNAANSIIRFIGWFILQLTSWLLQVAQYLWDFSLKLNTDFTSLLPVVRIGWTVTRDATDIFFIVILLIISIGTILRIQGYAAKQLLVRLVLMAILINFSLAIGSVVIDFSNVLGIQFLTAIHPEGKVGDVLMKQFSLAKVFDIPVEKGEQVFNDTGRYLIATIGSAILMITLVFVFFVSGILMFVRLAMLTMLLAVAPIAFLSYILPETQTHWRKWWDTLIQYSFFFPAFMFFLYISVIMITSINQSVLTGIQNAGIDPKNIYYLDNYALIASYLMGVVFLLASLIMGRQMGIAGSGAVIGLAKAGRKYVTGAIGSGALYPVRGVTRRIAETDAVQRLKDRLQESRYIPKGLGAAASRGIDAMLQRGATLGQMRPKSAEQTADFLARQDNESIARSWGSLSYMQKLALLRKLPKDRRDKLMDLLPEDQKALALRISRGFEGEGRAGELEAAEWQRRKAIDAEDGMRYFAQMSRAGKERALRTMDQKEQSDYVEKLRAAKLTDAADQSEEIVRTEFTQQQRAAYDVAGFQRLSTEEQLNRIGGLSNQAVSAFLHGKSPEERKAFIDALTRRADAVRATNPAEARSFDEQAARMENVMVDYFSPEDLRKHRVTLFNAEKDPAQIAMKWAGLTVQEQEEVMRARDPKQRASLLDKLEKHGGKLVADKAMGTMRDALTRAELAKTNAVLNIRKTGADRQTMFDALEDTDIDEVFNELKTPEEQWDYINSLSAVPDPITGKSQQDRARERMKQTLPPDAKDDFAAYEVANKMPNKTAAEQEARAKAFVDLTEKQRVKVMRNLRGKPRADLVNEVTVYAGATGTDGLDAMVDVESRLTQRERNQISREVCGKLDDAYGT